MVQGFFKFGGGEAANGPSEDRRFIPFEDKTIDE